jgi:large subunit ribosomal protein L6
MVKQALFKEILTIPEGVKVKLGENHQIEVEGPEGVVKKDFSHIRGISILKEDDKLIFKAHFPKGSTIALANTVINIIKNLLKGVVKNYIYVSKVCYSHFPASVEVHPQKEEIHIVNFLGERAPRKIKYNPNIVEAEVKDDDVYLIGPDKQELGQTAANIKRICRIRKKDPRVYQDGVYLYKILHGDDTILWQIR